MKVTNDLIDSLKALITRTVDDTVTAKDVWFIPEGNGKKLLNVLREAADRPEYGKFRVDKELVEKLTALATAKEAKVKPAKEAKVKPAKEAKVKPAKEAKVKVEASDAAPTVGKREKRQLSQLATATAKLAIGEVMYEKDLIDRGGYLIPQDEAKALVEAGEMVYAIDRNFTTGIVIPPTSMDLTLKATTVEFYRLPAVA